MIELFALPVPGGADLPLAGADIFDASALSDLTKVKSRQYAIVPDELKGDVNESLLGFSSTSLWVCFFF